LTVCGYVDSRYCGQPRVCYCLHSLGEVNCVNKQLFHIPNFDSEGNFDVLDIRRNHIKEIPDDILEKFAVIDIRHNVEFDCEDFAEKHKNIIYPMILSDCKQDVMNPKSSMSDISTEINHNMENTQVENKQQLPVDENTWSFATTTQAYVMNMSTFWVLNDTSLDRNIHSQVSVKLNIYAGYAIVASFVILVLVVTLMYGKKILRICNKYQSDPEHEILQEEEEETSFSLPEIHHASSPSHSFKQE
jgi:hypothetical protein